MISVDVYIYGAKSTAIGVARAIKLNYGKCNILGFIVSSLNGNPDEIEGIRVEELDNLTKKKSNEEKKYTNVIIATPVYVQEEIRNTLIEKGFTNIFSLSTYDEENMMREYYAKIAKFPSIKNLDGNSLLPKTFILEVKHHKDAELNNIYNNPSWVYPIQAGAACTKERIANLLDCEGDNISAINPLYCEETALYWLWKNMLEKDVNKYDYYGLYHYRRLLNINADDLKHAFADDVDVILPYPMLYLPNIREHHTRYSNEEEWEMMLKVVGELYPEYMEDYDRIFECEYMYNYNMMIGKGSVVRDYCSWLFPIMFKTEQLCEEYKIPFCKRYIAYFGESLLTWYFMHKQHKFKIMHTGRLLRD